MRHACVVLGALAALSLAEILTGPAGLDLSVLEPVRLPRVLGALTAGALLGVSGLVLQTLWRNPLADPYIMGVCSVSILSALCFYLAWRAWGAPYVGYAAGALLGAAASTAALTWLARRADLLVVLLTGVLLSFVAHSVTQLLLLALPPEELGFIYLGLQGSFAAYPSGPVGYAAAAAAIAVILAIYLNARHVAALVHGEEAAAGLGVDVRRAAALAVGAAAVAAGLVVALVGPVGFVGLMAPHMAQWISGRQRVDATLAVTAMTGAATALAADAVVRLALPREVPVNVPLSLVGAPAAVLLMWRYRHARGV